ncbi:MAG: branched-chain amino acid ABC transporter permease [Desulfobacteraceae bacterium]|nr:MAG: branched-chain amino acid ABC transporter permease [Desulfobacteraceae bacterium]
METTIPAGSPPPLDSPGNEMSAGARDTIPLIVGAIPFGIIFGTLAEASGISFYAAMAMSVFVFAGSSQFIALGMLSAGTGWPLIVLTTLVVNLRHLLYTATLLPYLSRLSGGWKAALAFWLTDETFVVAVKRYVAADRSANKHWYQLGSSLAMYVNWNACTLIGLTAGQMIPGIRSWGLEFAMSATFIGMVIPYLKTRPMGAAVCVAGATALWANDLSYKLGLILAALAGVAAGAAAETILKESDQEA